MSRTEAPRSRRDAPEGAAAPPGASCSACAHFRGEPADFERAYPLARALSSGWASVRDRDGLCALKGVYLSGRDSCPDFAPAE